MHARFFDPAGPSRCLRWRTTTCRLPLPEQRRRPDQQLFLVAQWLACTFPYRRFADTLTDPCARLGANVDRYSFIAVDLHHLLHAGLPAHPG